MTCLGIKKRNQQSSEEDKQDNTSDNKNGQSRWHIIPGVADANLENEEEYPPFVMRVVKVYQLLINQRIFKKNLFIPKLCIGSRDGWNNFI